VKTKFIFPCVLLLSVATAQVHQQPVLKGTIYGIVVGQDGEPAKRLGLTAEPLGVALAAVLPHTKTNDKGEYRFENVPWWGRYTVYADDEDAGYSVISTGPAGNGHPAEVEITPEHPEAELSVSLPPKAGFIEIHLTNRKNGAAIPGMVLAVTPLEEPESPLFTMSWYSDHIILVPPDTNLLLHIKSDGFREWDESIGTGKPLYVPSRSRLTLDVQLDAPN
jgi:hypothetical protein